MPTQTEIVHEWNAGNWSGVIIDYTKEDGSVFRTTTSTHAYVQGIGENSLGVIHLDGIEGGCRVDRVSRIPTPTDLPDFEIASSLSICGTCSKNYVDHAYDLNYPDNNGLPFLTKLCNGKLVKL